jgi:hypothetical protein
MVKLTEAREITPSPWHHPENEDEHLESSSTGTFATPNAGKS